MKMDTKLNHESKREYYKITQDITSLLLHIYYVKEDEEKMKCKDEEQKHTKSLQAKDEGVKANTPVNYPSLKQQVPP